MTDPKDIKEILKKTAKNMSKGNSPISSKTNPPIGNPACELCLGQGYIRKDYPVGHPNFGKMEICSCRESEIVQTAHDRLYAFSQLDKLHDLTFETFKERGHIGLGEMQANSIEQAFNQAKHYANNHKGWLLLLGKYGVGKTHLAAAIANRAVSLGIKTLFITVPDLLDALRFAYNDPEDTFENRFEEIRQCPFLIMDDFGTQNATQWAQEKLFQIINYRYINKLPMVITSNLELGQIEGRIRSRLEDPELVSKVLIQAPDFRRPTTDTGHHELSTLSLHGTRTFETFSLRKNEKLTASESKAIEQTFKKAMGFAKKPSGWLVLTGPYGSGKTHLAAAIANYQAGFGNPPLFIVVPDLFDHLRATFNPQSAVSYDRRFDEIKTTPLLILDDLGTQSMTPWVKEKLYQLFNYRYTANLPTVITTADSLDEMDPRIRSRMLDTRICKIYAITAPTYTGR